MQESFSSWVERISGPLALACVGATLQCLRGEWHGWKNFLISNAMAAFSAIICMSILPHYVHFEVAAGVAGIVGYSGGSLVDAVLNRLKREIETREALDGKRRKSTSQN